MANKNTLKITTARTSYDTVVVNIVANDVDNRECCQEQTRFAPLPPPFDDVLIKITVNSDWYVEFKAFCGLNKQTRLCLTSKVVKNGRELDLTAAYPMRGSISGRIDANQLIHFFNEDDSIVFQCTVKFDDSTLFDKYLHDVSMYESGINCDLTLLTEHKPLNANAEVLRSHSRPFTELIANSKDDDVVTLPEDYDTLAEMVFALHTGYARLADENLALKLLELANVYEISSIVDQCVVFLCRTMSPRAVAAIVEQSEVKIMNVSQLEESDRTVVINNLDSEDDVQTVKPKSTISEPNLAQSSEGTSIEIVSPQPSPQTDDSDSIYVVNCPEDLGQSHYCDSNCAHGDSNLEHLSGHTSLSSIVPLGEEVGGDDYTFVDPVELNIDQNPDQRRAFWRQRRCEFFEQLFVDGKGADVTLMVGRREIRASKFVLSASSPVFEELFKSSNHVQIENVDHDEMYSLIRSMYSGIVDINDVVAARKLAKLATDYAVDFALQQAEEYLRNAQEQQAN